MKLIQTVNTFSQKVPSNALINLGNVDRRVTSTNRCGVKTFTDSKDAITLNWLGYYKIDLTIVVKSEEAVEVTIGLISNNAIVNGAKIRETYVGGDTKTLNLSKIVRLECGCAKFPTEPLKIQLANVGEGEIDVLGLNLSIVKVE